VGSSAAGEDPGAVEMVWVVSVLLAVFRRASELAGFVESTPPPWGGGSS
jgi:hypothetical protein